ncbi:MAG: tRNA lysidine(34) synthetase TilS, partial [Chloroflexi bacterium]|nr:tRNA lysidine(34) synthetase TilS [Chloroflexota bacterium]
MEPERLVRTTENRIRHFARTQKLWARGERVVLAVSGGADSLCMLHAMARVARLDALSLVAAHLNHGMRGANADDDQAFVAAQAETLGVHFIAGKTDVPALARTARIGLEDAGRRARQEFLDRVIAETGAASAATAHTRSDHVETVLLHLFRGSGLQGLTGIRPRGEKRGGHRRIRP